MSLKPFCTTIVLLLSFVLQAQTNQEEVLFTIAQDSIYTSEFIRVYSKNLDLVKDETQKNVDEYLKLFVNYKLKLNEARTLGYDKKTSYVRELSNYKKQLAKNYLTDTKVTDHLVSEAYERVSNEIKASHILIRIAENANPQDTLVAYNQLLKLRERVLAEGYDAVKNEAHNGQTILAEELGYFSGFKMVYKFESVAFNTKVNDVSMPFRTKFGYHIIKVFEKRKSRGERTVAHIMIGEKKADTTQTNSETRINEIYAKLNQGEAFESLAKQFSDDKSSASKGGKLSPFSGGQLSAIEFENVAFGLQNINEVSQPFKTKYGWHIVKLIDKQAVKSFNELRPELEAKVKRDSRSQLINNALTDTLKKRYNISDEQPALTYFTSILNNDYFKRTWNIPVDFENNKPLLKIRDKQLTYRDFANYIVKSQRRVKGKKSFSKIISEQYKSFFESSLIQYQEDNLEADNPDFAHIVNEYRDGLLLFDLMENTIWNAGKTDSVGLKSFYNINKENYFFNKRVDAVVASSAKQSTIKKVIKLLEKNQTPEQIKSKLNTKNKVDVIFTSDIMDAEHQALPKNFNFNTGISKIHEHNDAYVVVKANKVIPKVLKSFEESKGHVISDFQEDKEKKWLEELRGKYEVKINQDALTKVKTQINSQ